MSRVLHGFNLTVSNTVTLAYTVPIGKSIIANIALTNRNAGDVKYRLYFCPTGESPSAQYQFGEEITLIGKGSEKSVNNVNGIALEAGDAIHIWSNTANITVLINGIARDI